MHLGEPAERVELPPESVVSVEPGTPLQFRPTRATRRSPPPSDRAPPEEQAGADFLADPEL